MLIGGTFLLKNFRLFLSIIFFLSFSIQYAAASTYVDVEDVDIYNTLSLLETEGVINDALLSTKPLSRVEVVRLVNEAEINAAGRSEFIKDLVQTLKQRVKPDDGNIKPVDSVYAAYVNTNADVLAPAYGGEREKQQAFNADNDGDLYDRGSNFRVGFTSRLEDLGPVSIYLNPEFRASDTTEDGVLKKGYGVLDFSWIDVVIGKDSQWWGPGYSGALLLSNNAEPLTMIKFTSPRPLALPWIFKYLGPFQYDIFATRLNDNSNRVPPSNLWGFRFDFKPLPIIEIGLEHTEQISGAQDLGTWADSVIGTAQHQGYDNTDGRAGYDLKLALPFRLQPMQVYLEADAEDNVHLIPSQWAYLSGIYLPRILNFERIGVRVEYATTHMYNHPGPVWYTHVITGGYTYDDLVIGHHMGTDSEDLFEELSYHMPEIHTDLFLSYDQEIHNISGPVLERTKEFKIAGKRRIVENVDVTLSCGYGWVYNPGNVAGTTNNVYEVASEVRYWF